MSTVLTRRLPRRGEFTSPQNPANKIENFGVAEDASKPDHRRAAQPFSVGQPTLIRW
jgi:hypothetical protein